MSQTIFIHMSRNKLILLIAVLALGLYLIPDSATGLYAKDLLKTIGAYVLLFMIVWLAISLRFLKRSLSACMTEPNNENVKKAIKWLRLSFDVKRTIGDENMKNFYGIVNKSKKVNIDFKNQLHDILIRKSIKVPLPMAGKN